MKNLFFIAFLFLGSCNPSKYLFDELQFQQLTAVKLPHELVNSLLIVGTGNVETRQVIDLSMEHFSNALNHRKVYNTYFFVASEALNEKVVVQKMAEVKSDQFKYLLFIAEENPAKIIASGPRMALNLDMTLYEKDNDNYAWKANVAIMGKVYKKDHSQRISELLMMHLRANRYIP